MKLLQIYEAEVAAKNVGVALPKIASYLSRKLGVTLIKVPGVEHFHNSTGNGYGIRYIVSGSTRCIRINWNTDSTGNTANIHSIDLFNGSSRDPSFTITTKGISFAQALPMVATIARSPSIGRFRMFPVNPAVAVTEQVVTEAEEKKYPDSVAGVKSYLKDDAAKYLVNQLDTAKFTADPSVEGVWAVDFKDGTRAIVYLAGYRDPFGNIRDHNDFETGETPTKKVRESAIFEAHRDDFTAEEALNDFLRELSRGETFTRMEFIGKYHPINVGLFDIAIQNFKDRFRIENRRVSLANNSKLEALKDSILSKAGIVEVTRGGRGEIYLKTDQEEEVEKEDEHIPYEDTLEHLQGLVVALIKGSTNALFVAGKGGTGKTQTVERVLHENGLTDGKGYFKNSGSASASGVYTLLYHHRNDIILFDDSDGALRDIDARNLIKAATDTKKVRKLVWNKKSSFIFNPDEEDPAAYEDDLSMAPQYFDFKGRIIFISNLPLNQLDPDGALRTRAFVINVNPTDDEMYNHMGKILMDIKLEDGLTLDRAKREHVLQVVKSSKRKGDVSLRKLVRALNLAASEAPNWEKLVELYA